MNELPKGCFKFINYERIIGSDIYNNRLTWSKVSTERALRHFLIFEEVRKFFTPFWKEPDYYRVRSATTYEMYSPHCDWIWGETDLTGLEWRFKDKEDALEFARKQ